MDTLQQKLNKTEQDLLRKVKITKKIRKSIIDKNININKMITKFTGNGLWFTSDTHFKHSKILEFCNRPFNTIEEHDQTLINNWNSVIGPDDTVFHLGDFVFGGFPKWKEIRDQLNGHIILIVGNHK